MMLASTKRGGAALAAAGVVAIVYGLRAPLSIVWPPVAPISASGLWLLQAIASLPIGDPMARHSIAAFVAVCVAAACLAAALSRSGFPPAVAVLCAAASVLGLSAWRQGIGDAPGALAAALVAAAVWIAVRETGPLSKGPAIIAGVAASVLLALAGSLQPILLPAIPLIVTRTLGASWPALAAATVAGIAVAWFDAPRLVPLGAATYFLREWSVVGTLLVGAGIAAPLWGAPSRAFAVCGVALVAALAALGQPAPALAALPALAVAHGVASLQPVAGRAAIGLAMVVPLVLALARWQEPHQGEWRLPAWRDAVERAVPAGSLLATADRSAAAIASLMFRGRASALDVAIVPRDQSGAAVSEAPFVLGDARQSGIVENVVALGHADLPAYLAALPRDSIVGLAVSGSAAAADPAMVARVVSALAPGTRPPSGPQALIAVTGSRDARADVYRDRIHVLIGEPIAGGSRRSPADFELRAADDQVVLRLIGRDIASARGWAVIVLDAYGGLVESHAADRATSWPIRLNGLDLWPAAGPRVSGS